MPNQNAIREQITKKIIEALEKDIVPWRKPWRVSPNSGRPTNVVSKKPYSGVNPLLLELHNLRHNFESKWFGTFEQWKSLNATVKKRPENVPPGQWGCQIVFYKPLSKTVTDPQTGEEKLKQFAVLRSFTVFNVDQVTGEALDKYRVDADPGDGPSWPDFPKAQELIDATGATIKHHGDSAYYKRPVPEGTWPNHTDGDYIVVPPRSRFEHLGAYFETVFHELAHLSELRIGFDHDKHGYAMGELCAEIASCMISTELQIPDGEDLKNHAMYLKSWLEAMKADPSFIFKASTWASKEADHLLSFTKKAEAESQPDAAEAA